MQSEPKIEQRPEQPYLGKRAVMQMSDFATHVPPVMAEVSEWLDSHGVQPAGAPFIRYHVIDMPSRMDIEVGVPVGDATHGSGGVEFGTLPAGRYAVLTYTGASNSIPANKKLIEWTAEQDEEMSQHRSSEGDVFEARYETQLTDPKAEPDQSRWEAEVAIKLRD